MPASNCISGQHNRFAAEYLVKVRLHRIRCRAAPYDAALCRAVPHITARHGLRLRTAPQRNSPPPLWTNRLITWQQFHIDLRSLQNTNKKSYIASYLQSSACCFVNHACFCIFDFDTQYHDCVTVITCIRVLFDVI